MKFEACNLLPNYNRDVDTAPLLLPIFYVCMLNRKNSKDGVIKDTINSSIREILQLME